MSKYYTTTEVAKILKRTPARIVQLIKEGSLEAEMIGRDYLIKKATLKTFKLKSPTGRPKNATKKL